MNSKKTKDVFHIFPEKGSALLIINVQEDFLPGGALPIRNGDGTIGSLNKAIEIFAAKRLPIFAAVDWHTTKSHSGRRPQHCIEDTHGAQFPPLLHLPDQTTIVHYACQPEEHKYSCLSGSELNQTLRKLEVHRLYLGGLATEYGILQTTNDLLEKKYQVYLLEDAIAPLSNPTGEDAFKKMMGAGAIAITTSELLA